MQTARAVAEKAAVDAQARRRCRCRSHVTSTVACMQLGMSSQRHGREQVDGEHGCGDVGAKYGEHGCGDVGAKYGEHGCGDVGAKYGEHGCGDVGAKYGEHCASDPERDWRLLSVFINAHEFARNSFAGTGSLRLPGMQAIEDPGQALARYGFPPIARNAGHRRPWPGFGKVRVPSDCQECRP
jgi:hypothetical protein